MSDTRWWELDDPSQEIWELAGHLDTLDAGRRYDAAAFYRFATGRELPFQSYGLSSTSASTSVPDFSAYQRPTHNVIAECEDTLTAHVGRNRPWVKVQTSGADGKLRKRAKNRGRFFDGWAQQVSLYEHTRRCFKDSLTFGDSFLKIYSVGKEIKCERILATQLRVDPAEAQFGEPRTLIQVPPGVPRDNLLALYPDKADKIVAAELISGLTQSMPNETPLVAVIEIWKLPPPGGKKGRHCITINNACLLDEPWERETFPFARLSYDELSAGYWGTGLVEQLMGYQYEIDRISLAIQTMQLRMGASHWLIHTGAQVNTDHLGARYPASAVKWSGQHEPKAIVPQCAPPELYAARQWWIDRARESAGINQLSSSGALPVGVKSGDAITAYNDAASGRHVILGQRLERFVLDIYKLVIAEAATAHPSVKVPGTNKPLLSWKDCEAKDDEIFEAPFPISSLPHSPTGRYERIENWRASKIITRVEYLRLMESPDTEAYTDLATSQATLVEMAIDSMIEDGEYFPPEPYQDLETALTDAQLRYCSERARGTDERGLELIRRYIEDVRALGGTVKPQAPQPTDPESAPPGGDPMAAPPMAEAQPMPQG